jgi:hypothetical protein
MRPRLPDYAWDALAILWREADRQDRTGFSKATAQSLLADDPDLALTDTDIEHTLALLSQRGELYPVDDVLRITGLVLEEPPAERLGRVTHGSYGCCEDHPRMNQLAVC